MKNLINLLLAFLLIVSSVYAEEKKDKPEEIKVLVFSKTSGFRHKSISNGVKMIYELAHQENWLVTATENSELFTNDFLETFDVVVFLNPTQDVLNDKQQKAFEKFIKSKKGFVGIHASADCEYDWQFYGDLNGAYFLTHPPAQEGTVIFEDYNHPAMVPFKDMKTYTTIDEWYTFKENPRENVHVLARLDESSITKSKDDKWRMNDHPLIWYHEYEGTRAFYTVFGHTDEAFDDPNVRDHITGAINWVARRID